MRRPKTGELSDNELLDRVWKIAMTCLQSEISDNETVSQIIGIIEVNRKPGLTAEQQAMNREEQRAKERPQRLRLVQ